MAKSQRTTSAPSASQPDELAVPDPASTAPLETSYEQAARELDALVEAMDSGQLPLDDLLQHFQRGSQLLRHCRAKLQAIQQQVSVVDDTRQPSAAPAPRAPQIG